MRSTPGGLVRCTPDRCEHGVRSTAVRIAMGAITTLVLTLSVGEATAQCLLVRERGGPEYAPHFALHFGEATAVPRSIQCSTSLDKDQPVFRIPIYAYNLWDGADAFDLALRTPQPPQGFDRGPAISGVEMQVSTEGAEAVTSLHLSAESPVCGPVYLGCLRLGSADLPENFLVTIADHRLSGRCATRSAGAWRSATIDDGAHIAPHAVCAETPCGLESPVLDLHATAGEHAGIVALSWTNGSGNFTLLRYRMDGRWPLDPWDGELLAFLPASVSSFAQQIASPGEARIAAWSITRGPFGNLYAASNVECGSLASVVVQLPVGVASRAWGQVKTLYR